MSESLCIELELTRIHMPQDPLAFVGVDQAYSCRIGGGGAVTTGKLAWKTGPIKDVLSMLARRRGDLSEVHTVLRRTLTELLKPTDWARRAAEVQRAVDEGRTVELLVRTNAAELSLLPWSMLPLPGGETVATQQRVHLRLAWSWRSTRSGSAPGGHAKASPNTTGSVLFAWSAEGGPVPSKRQFEDLRAACTAGRHAPPDQLGDVSPRSLEEALARAEAQGRPVAVLHLLARVRQTGGQPVIALDGGNVSVDELTSILRPHAQSLRLVVLSACGPPRAERAAGPLPALAMALHRLGIEAVVGPVVPLNGRGASLFVERFYAELFVGMCTIDVAMASARRALAQTAGFGPDAVSLQLWSASRDLRPLRIQPYWGLRALDARRDRFLFGRDREMASLVQGVDALRATKRPRLFAVIGSPGTGKSSLVQARGLPALQAGFDEVLHLRPHELGRLGERRSRERRLVYIDQLEDIFTEPESTDATRARFLEQLWMIATDKPGSVVLATLRIDFLERCSQIALPDSSTFEQLICDTRHHLIVGRPGPVQLREMVARPAAIVGLALEEGLVDALVDQVAAEPDALMLLSFATHELWRRPRAHPGLRLADLEALEGGVPGALAHAAHALIDRLRSHEREMARTVGLALVEPRRGDLPPARRRRVIARLRPSAPKRGELFDRILSMLTAAGFLETGGPEELRWVELSHASLIEHWSDLRQWVDDVATEAEGIGDPFAHTEAVQTPEEPGDLDDVIEGLLDSEDPDESEAEPPDEGDAHPVIRELVSSPLPTSALQPEGDVSHRAAAELRDRLTMAGATLAEAAGDTFAQRCLLAAVSRPQAVPGWTAMTRSLLSTRRAHTLRVFRAHGPGPMSATFSRDGTRILTVSSDGTAGIWRATGFGGPMFLRGHEGPLTHGAFSPDGTRVLTAGTDLLVKIWCTKDGSLSCTLRGHTDTLTHASFDPTGRRVLTASADGTARTWALEGEGSQLDRLDHGVAVVAASFSPNGQRIATAARDKQVRVWNMSAAEETRSRSEQRAAVVSVPQEPLVLTGHQRAVVSVHFSPNGQRLATASDDGNVRIWRTHNGDCLTVLEAHPEGVAGAIFDPAGEQILTGSVDGAARVWASDGHGEPWELEGHALGIEEELSILDLAFSPDGHRALTASADGTARIWWTSGRGQAAVLEGHEGPVHTAVFSPDGTQVLTASSDGTARTWSALARVEATVLRGHRGRVHSAVFSPSGDQILTASADGTAHLWSRGGAGLPQVLNGRGGPMRTAIFNPNGTRVLTATEDVYLLLWTAENADEPLAELRHETAVRTASFSSDGEHILTLTEDQGWHVWRIYTDVLVGRTIHERQLRKLSFSPDGQHLLGLSLEGRAWVCKADGSETAALEDESDTVWVDAMFGPKGVHLVTASGSIAHLWTADGSEELSMLEGHSDALTDIAFSPDGRLVLTASADHTARVWPVDAGAPPVVLTGHASRLSHGRFSPDGRHVLTMSVDGEVRIWSVEGGGASQVIEATGDFRQQFVDPARRVAFSPDSSRVLVASKDSVSIWEVDGDAQPVVLEGHTGTIRQAIFSPDGSSILTASADHTTRIWHAHDVPSMRQALTHTELPPPVSPWPEPPPPWTPELVGIETCLSPRQRRAYLFETADDAEARWRRAEARRWKRPFPEDVEQ